MTAPAPFFSCLVKRRLLDPLEIRSTSDHFQCLCISLSELLRRADIHTFYNDRGEARRCDLFFDDWYLYAVTLGHETVYSLFKMREQENDEGLIADADIPGVTVCFIAFEPSSLLACLDCPTAENLQALNARIHRVVAQRGQRHHPLLKQYFVRCQAQAPYLIAHLYTHHVASFSKDGALPVPARYAQQHLKNKRLRDFILQNNRAAGRTVCDHRRLFLPDAPQLSPQEELAILATHTANTSFHSFAAEVRFHACCLVRCLRLPLPFVKKTLYDSAVRADMSIDCGVWHNLFPFYHPRSRLVRRQRNYHVDV